MTRHLACARQSSPTTQTFQPCGTTAVKFSSASLPRGWEERVRKEEEEEEEMEGSKRGREEEEESSGEKLRNWEDT